MNHGQVYERPPTGALTTIAPTGEAGRSRSVVQPFITRRRLNLQCQHRGQLDAYTAPPVANALCAEVPRYFRM